MSASLSIIFEVVPELMSAWKPEMAPQAMVMKQNGKSGPGMIGPPPFTYSDSAGILVNVGAGGNVIVAVAGAGEV